jgi:hypothetical protein
VQNFCSLPDCLGNRQGADRRQHAIVSRLDLPVNILPGKSRLQWSKAKIFIQFARHFAGREKDHVATRLSQELHGASTHACCYTPAAMVTVGANAADATQENRLPGVLDWTHARARTTG